MLLLWIIGVEDIYEYIDTMKSKIPVSEKLMTTAALYLKKMFSEGVGNSIITARLKLFTR